MNIWNGLINDIDINIDFDFLNTLDVCKNEIGFLQFGSNECLDYCPTGALFGTLPKRCLAIEAGLELSTAIFTEIPEFPMSFFEAALSKGKYLGGAVDLGLDLIRGIDDPIFLPFRGLYFDGFNAFMRFTDFIFAGE